MKSGYYDSAVNCFDDVFPRFEVAIVRFDRFVLEETSGKPEQSDYRDRLMKRFIFGLASKHHSEKNLLVKVQEIHNHN